MDRLEKNGEAEDDSDEETQDKKMKTGYFEEQSAIKER